MGNVRGVHGIQSRINDLFEETFGPASLFDCNRRSSVSACGCTRKQGFLPYSRGTSGNKKDAFNLEIKDGTLTLSGERKFEEPANGIEYHRVERVAGKFVRSFSLPQPVKSDEIKASYRDGILKVHVPKAEEAKPKQIAINVQ